MWSSDFWDHREPLWPAFSIRSHCCMPPEASAALPGQSPHYPPPSAGQEAGPPLIQISWRRRLRKAWAPGPWWGMEEVLKGGSWPRPCGLPGAPLNFKAEVWEPSPSLGWKVRSLSDNQLTLAGICLAEKQLCG